MKKANFLEFGLKKPNRQPCFPPLHPTHRRRDERMSVRMSKNKDKKGDKLRVYLCTTASGHISTCGTVATARVLRVDQYTVTCTRHWGQGRRHHES